MRIAHTKHGHLLLDETSKDFITGWLMLNGEYEWDVVNLCGQLAGVWDDGTILDVGANLGTITVPLALSFPRFKVHSYEPQRLVAYQLIANIMINRCKNVEVHQFALGETNSTMDVKMPNYATAENIGGFSLDSYVNQNEPMSRGEGNVERIEVRRLDDSEFESIRLIKLDVEGYELNVLKGAVETLKKHKYPPIVFESWSHKWWETQDKELRDWIENLGYKCHRFDGWTNVATHPKYPVRLEFKTENGTMKYGVSKKPSRRRNESLSSS